MIHENLALGFSPVASGNQERSNGPTSMSLFFPMAFLNQGPHMNRNTEHDFNDYFLIYFPGMVYNKNHSECKRQVKWLHTEDALYYQCLIISWRKYENICRNQQ